LIKEESKNNYEIPAIPLFNLLSIDNINRSLKSSSKSFNIFRIIIKMVTTVFNTIENSTPSAPNS